jgi:hypothetical protein
MCQKSAKQPTMLRAHLERPAFSPPPPRSEALHRWRDGSKTGGELVGLQLRVVRFSSGRARVDRVKLRH